MNRHTVRILLREVAVLVTALAFLVAGNLVSREHLFARAGLPGPAPTLCHGDPDATPATPDAPGKQRSAHLCDHCVACQVPIASAVLPIFGPRATWHLASTPLASPEQLSTTRPDLPPATGPPHLG